MIELNCLTYESMLANEGQELVVAGARSGRYNYLMIGGKTIPYLLFERLPAPLVERGVIGAYADVDFSDVKIEEVKDEEDKLIGCKLVYSNGESVVPVNGDGVKDTQESATAAYLKSVLAAKKIPFDKAEDLKLLQGVAPDMPMRFTIDREVKMTAVIEGDEDPPSVILGRGLRLCEFNVPVSDIRLMRFQNSESLAIAPPSPKVPFFVVNTEAAGCGLCRLAMAFTSLQPETPKEVGEALKGLLSDLEDVHKVMADNVKEQISEQETQFKEMRKKLTASLSAHDGYLRDFKKDVSELIKILPSLTSSSDVSKVDKLEKAMQDLRDRNAELVTENKKYDKIRKIAAELGA